MSETAIGWTDKVWNPVTGCSKVSEGCRNCYAEAISLRYGRSQKPWAAQYAAENVVLHPERLDAPLKWKQPSRCFVNSMSDLFHEQVPDSFIYDIFTTMTRADRHTFQVLTKRPERMAAWGTKFYREQNPHLEPLPNVWLGTSVEHQAAADQRVHHLLMTPAAVRFLSCEPLLGPIDFWPMLTNLKCAHGNMAEEPDTYIDGCHCLPDRSLIDWVIVGGESGPKHRPMDMDWMTGIINQARFYGIATFVKQDSGQYPGRQGRIPDDLWLHQFPEPQAVAGGAG